MKKKVDITFLIISSLCIGVSVLDFFGFLDNITFLADRIPSLVLLISAAIGLYLIIEKRNKLDKIDLKLANGFDELIKMVNGTKTHIFNNNVNMFNYITEKISNAKDRVDDLSWGCSGGQEVVIRTDREQAAYKNYLKKKISCVKTGIEYREIITFTSLERVNRAEEMLKHKLDNYYLNYYEPNDSIPRMVFIIIDSKEVIFVSYKQPFLPDGDEIRMAIEHQEIVHLFQDYFETAWHAADVIKNRQKYNPAPINNAKASINNYIE